MQVDKLDMRFRNNTQQAELEARLDNERWSRGSRLVFMIAAAAICWMVPLLIVYFAAF